MPDLATEYRHWFPERPTLGELVEKAEEMGLSLGEMVVAEAMAIEGKTRTQVLSEALGSFAHNFRALEMGLTTGRSFLLGTVGSDLNGQPEGALIADRLIDRALVYTLATEVGNHEIGLRPCAGTGDSCPYTGLLRALQECGFSHEKVAVAAAIILKVGSVFRAGKQTTGCNMEGYGAGAACTAAALTDLRGGGAVQAAKAAVLALSPAIAVPCTPRVMVAGLCASHISAAILVGNNASNLVLKTSLPVEVDIDVMIAMAARVHVEAAPTITAINLEYLEPYFQRKQAVESFVDPVVAAAEAERSARVLEKARQEIRRLMSRTQPLTRTLGDVVVGGSSLAVGSPTNMARICHGMISGKIRRIEIELTPDLFLRRAINVPAILMGAIFGARTDDVEAYRGVLSSPEIKEIEIRVRRVETPEVQRIWIETDGQSAMVDARNRGGGRVGILTAEPSREAAVRVAERLGIDVVPEN